MNIATRIYRKARRELGIDVVVDQKLILFHQPKCGGTSLSDALLSQYHRSQSVHLLIMEAQQSVQQLGVARNYSEWIREYRRFKEFLLLYHLNLKKHLIIGHVPFSLAADKSFGSEYKYAIVFRDPVERFISHYKYQKLLVDTPFNYQVPDKPFATIEDELEAFLKSEEAANWGSNYAVDNSGISEWEGEIPIGRMVDAAIVNLGKFEFIGHTEDLPRMLEQMRRGLGGNFPLRRSMTTESLYRNPEQKEALDRLFKDSAALQRIRTLCEPNYRVYQAAIAMEQ